MDFDLHTLEKLRRLAEGRLFARVLELFRQNVVRQLDILSASSGQGKRAASAAHSIKSSAANFGATGLFQMAERLELRACQGQVFQPNEVEELKREFEQVLKFLQSLSPGRGVG